MSLFPEESPQKALSVFELTSQIKDLLEGSFQSVWVSGEISNFSRPQSGHCYLTLKDERAQIRAVLWRTTASRLKFELEDGLEVICQGDVDVYAPRGSYQLVIRQIEPKGIGALELALRKLKEKLTAEGLFEPGRKRPLPRFPRRIAFVTSPTGAAIRDFLEVLRRRWRGADVLVAPVRVQGEGAAAGDRRRHRRRQSTGDSNRLPRRRPRRRQPGRPVGVQRRAGRAGDPRLADSGRLGGRSRNRRDAGRPGRRRAGANAQRGGGVGRAGRR